MITLIGGGWQDATVYGPFLAAAGTAPEVACVVVDEGDGAAQFDRWRSVLTAVAPCRPVAVLVPVGEVLDVSRLGDADGLLVCGGLTPAYAAALVPGATALRAWLATGRPYAGFSAGAAVAAEHALIGGWQVGGRPVCPADAAEDLDEVTVVPGLGLVPGGVEVHAAQWGTLGRALAAVAAGRAERVVALDEDAALVEQADGSGLVVGAGAVHLVTGDAGGGRTEVVSLVAGQVLPPAS